MQVFAETMGSGPDVICLPGVGWSGREMFSVAEPLSAICRTHMLDLPGIGRSDGIGRGVTFRAYGDWLAAYLRACGIARAHLVGHSLGATVALACAREYPDTVASLTLLDGGYRKPSPWPVEMGSMRALFPLVRGFDRVAAAVSRKRPFVAELVDGAESDDAQQVAGSFEPDESVLATDKAASLVRRFRERGLYGLSDDRYLRIAVASQPETSRQGISFSMGLYRSDPCAQLAQVAVPTLLIHGTRAPRPDMQAIQMNDIERMRSVCAGQSNIEVMGLASGHYVHWSSDAHLQLILDGIRSLVESYPATGG
ncbi:MAG: alpha/beta hydrolase [Firmicutes bacterium]|nr:alpha/beta hydrolase [Bacillota bacterium]